MMVLIGIMEAEVEADCGEVRGLVVRGVQVAAVTVPTMEVQGRQLVRMIRVVVEEEIINLVLVQTVVQVLSLSDT